MQKRKRKDGKFYKLFRKKYLGRMVLFNSVIYILYLEATRGHGDQFSCHRIFSQFALRDKFVKFEDFTITLWVEPGHLQ